ncbi:MAG: hypothetical protein A3C07_05190 [Candidatus Sungbacteria bacterium RIFCSPHIGHO2_02_FULL_47_11]|uniref:PDZ domain-containing protein n=1 Tax=Candidatus Sungbacteria bacterium RIFCSPHIGHO2_02_FULL_47_11 TaxID=1802270 RepID=A0A1G2KQV9_9BACT|nr:MAG: hypothetical protein A3C07_05190 [Candidatus Sungbacteria bacterium RIFCSPHIGHO2_02_FULL_47_11]
MFTLILLIVAISVLILVHEWGHFYSARKLGVSVEEFGFGFPPRLVSRMWRGVRYSFNLLPLGGFVKIYGEHGEGESDQKSFMSRPVWQRFIILGAGVFMNIVLAWLFFSVGAAVGVPHIAQDDAQDIPVSIIAVLPETPADRAGFRAGDQILEMRSGVVNAKVSHEGDIRAFVDAYAGEEVKISVRRGGEVREVSVIPRARFPQGEGPLGIALAKLTVVRVPWYRAPVEGAETLWRSIVVTASGLAAIARELVSNGRTSVPVSGPVGIFFFAQDSTSLGIAYILQFVGLLSVNLAILNILPIPALDGGRILFLVIEKARGVRINPAIENIIHTAGFVILILLMVVVTYYDIVRVL